MRPTKPALLVAAAFALNLAFAAPGANADPRAAGLKDGGAQSRLWLDAHGCHYSCACGPLKDFGRERVYHRHLHMLCLPVRCDRKQDCDPTRSTDPRGDGSPQ
jgi:hypothetical protein